MFTLLADNIMGQGLGSLSVVFSSSCTRIQDSPLELLCDGANIGMPPQALDIVCPIE